MVMPTYKQVYLNPDSYRYMVDKMQWTPEQIAANEKQAYQAFKGHMDNLFEQYGRRSMISTPYGDQVFQDLIVAKGWTPQQVASNEKAAIEAWEGYQRSRGIAAPGYGSSVPGHEPGAVEARQQAAEAQIKRQEFEAKHIKLPGGDYVRIDEYSKLPQKIQDIGYYQGFEAMQRAIQKENVEVEKAIQSSPKELRDAYYQLGIEGYNKAVEDYNKRIQNRSPQEVFQSLVDKGQIPKNATFERIDSDGNLIYSVPAEAATAKANWTVWSAVQSQAYRDRVNELLKTRPHLSQFDAENIANSEFKAKGATLTPKPSLVKQVQMANEHYNSLSKEEQAAIAKTWRETPVKGLSMIFPPAMALSEDVTIKDIKPIDWAAGAAQVALLATPFVAAPLAALGSAGRAAVFAIPIAGGAVFATDTAVNWNNMSVEERAFSMAMDALILGTAIGSAVRVRMPKRYGELTGKVVDTSAKAGKAKTAAKVEATLDDAMSNMSEAIRTKNVKLLKTSGQQIKVIAEQNPNSPVSKLMLTKGETIVANADDYIKLAGTKPSPKDVKAVDKGLKANEDFIKNAEEVLKKTDNPKTREAIQKALKEARRQVKVAERTKVAIPLEKIEPFPEGKYLPAIPKEKALTRVKPSPGLASAKTAKPKESAFPGIKPKVEVQTDRGSTNTIPREAFGRMTIEQIAQRYGVEADEIVWAVARTLPEVREQIKIAIFSRPFASPDEKAKAAVFIRAISKAQSQLREETKTRTQPLSRVREQIKEQIREQLKEQIKEKVATEPKQQLIEKLTTKQATQQKPKIKVRPESKDSLEFSELTPKEREGAVTWKQGFGWWVVLKDKRAFFIRAKPEGATVIQLTGEPSKTIQVHKGRSFSFNADLGITDIRVKTPSRTPGKVGAIKFKSDTTQSTHHEIHLGGWRKVGLLSYKNVPGGTLVSRRARGKRRK